jgi:hypothetical protein
MPDPIVAVEFGTIRAEMEESGFVLAEDIVVCVSHTEDGIEMEGT